MPSSTAVLPRLIARLAGFSGLVARLSGLSRRSVVLTPQAFSRRSLRAHHFGRFVVIRSALPGSVCWPVESVARLSGPSRRHLCAVAWLSWWMASRWEVAVCPLLVAVSPAVAVLSSVSVTPAANAQVHVGVRPYLLDCFRQPVASCAGPFFSRGSGFLSVKSPRRPARHPVAQPAGERPAGCRGWPVPSVRTRSRSAPIAGGRLCTSHECRKALNSNGSSSSASAGRGLSEHAGCCA